MPRHVVRRLLRAGGLVLCAAVVLGQAAQPALARAAYRQAAPTPPAAPAAQSWTGQLGGLFLPNGSRFAMTGSGRGPAVTVVPAARHGLAADEMGLYLGGRHYEVPAAALPYLGRGLDWSLFDVEQLARAEADGRLPVQVSFRGRLHSLPGVTVTHAAAGRAAGYLTAASARAFGAAVVRQFRRDHMAGRYGSDGMFAGGESVALAGAAPLAPARAVRPDLPMYTLRVTGTTQAGRPDTGDAVFVVNADNSDLFGDLNESASFFYRGAAKFSVPAGHYFAIAGFYSASGALRVVALPQFTVSGNTTVALAARSATDRVSFSTPRPATLQDVNLAVERVPALGYPFEAVGDTGTAPMWINQTAVPPSVGGLKVSVHATLTSPAGVRPAYQYVLAHESASGIIPAQQYVESAASLAVLRDYFYQPGRSTGRILLTGSYPWETATWLIFDPVRLPGQLVSYVSGDPAAFWGEQYWPDAAVLAGGQSDTLRQYTPGQSVTQQWGAAPLHPAVNVNAAGPANPAPVLPSASRAGNTLTLDLTPFSDSVPGHLGAGFSAGLFGPAGRITGRYELAENGRTIASGNAMRAAGGSPSLLTQARLSGPPAVVRFVLTATRTGAAYGSPTASRTVWTWRSSYEAGGTLPPGWTCTPPGSGSATRRCRVEPMLTLGYAVAGLTRTQTVRPGPQRLDITAGHLQLARAAAITHASVQVSVNGGRTWRQVPVTGAGRFTATFSDRTPGPVALRVTASDAAGGRIRETVQDAYQVS